MKSVAAPIRTASDLKANVRDGSRLFHKTQVRPLTMEEKQAQKAESVAAVARHDTGKAKGAKVVPINANPQ